MGQAKARKQSPASDYGYPSIFVLQLFDRHNNELVDINLTIKSKGKRLLTNKDALAMAGTLIGYFVNPTDHNWQCVQNAIASYCRPLAADPNLEAIKPIAPNLPVEFWAWVRETSVNEQGDRLLGPVLESRDIALGLKCKVTFASRPGVAPEQEGVQMKQYQGAVFEKQLLGVSK